MPWCWEEFILCVLFYSFAVGSSSFLVCYNKGDNLRWCRFGLKLNILDVCLIHGINTFLIFLSLLATAKQAENEGCKYQFYIHSRICLSLAQGLRESVCIKEFACIKAALNFFRNAFCTVNYVLVLSLTFRPYDPCLGQCQKSLGPSWMEGWKEGNSAWGSLCSSVHQTLCANG